MMMPEKEIETFCPVSRVQWREWLRENHDKKQSVWLIYHKKRSAMPTLSWSEAVDEALCFGWIDSLTKPMDAEKYRQFFSRRKPKSVWSKVNKEKIQRLIAEGMMTQAGFDSVETAKQNGSWTILDEVDALLIPADLEHELQKRPDADRYFSGLCRSDKRAILQWVILAKRPETRQNRITEIVERATQQLKPKQFSGQRTGPAGGRLPEL